MNSYFDDDSQKIDEELGGDNNVGTLDKGQIDSDLSKLFDQDGKNSSNNDEITINEPVKEKTDAPTPSPLFGPAMPKPEKKEEVINDEIVDLDPAPIKEDKKPTESFSKPSSSNSLDETEKKLKNKKEDISKQKSELEAKLKKIEDTLAKISDLRGKEDEIMRAAQEIA
jgi:hypothetical protein